MAEAEEAYEEVGEEMYEEEEGGEEYAEEGAPAEGQDMDLEAMERKVKEMEEEVARLKGTVPAGTGDAAPGSTAGAPSTAAAAGGASAADIAAKEEVDSRSIFIGQVDYACTPEELQQHFAQCGTVNRVTILTDRAGNPKGYAYLEFLEVDAVQNALLLDNSELRGRHLKVSAKRTNVPGLKVRGRGRGRGGFYPAPYGGRGGYFPPYGGRGRGYYGGGGYAPRGRGRGRGFYAPY